MFIIHDTTPESVTHDPQFSRGCVPRDYSVQPREMFAGPSDIPVIPRSEWDARIQEQEDQKSSLEHLWNGAGWKCLDQDGFGYCWAHSTTHSVIFARLVANLPYVPLSAFAVAATIKNGRDEGGWAALSAQFAREKGIPSQAKWPQGSASLSHGTDDCWADAAKHKITAEYIDLGKDLWEANLTFDQVATCLLMNIPCPVDFNWWGHSVCGARLVKIEAGSYGIRILNSWYVGAGQPWGENGFATLQGQKTIPNGALATRMVTAS